jgi:hypothetical protein
MTEIGFLLDAGAVAFTDCDAVTTDTRVLSRCMTYARGLGALILGHPQDPGLSRGAAVTSGKFAALKGLPATPPMAERMGLERDLALVEMTGVRYHADQLSTAAALPALKRAKAAGLDVTAGVSIHHLTLNELDVGDFRTFFKLKPPLRSEDDRLAMVLPWPTARSTSSVRCTRRRTRNRNACPSRPRQAVRWGLRRCCPRRCAFTMRDRSPCLPTLIARDVAEPRPPLRPAGRITRPRCAGRPGAVRPDAPFRPRPVHAQVEIQEHALRRRAPAGPGAGTWVGGKRVFDAEVTA